MGILTGDQIIDEVNCGRIKIDPFKRERVNPNSYDLTLSPTLVRYDEVMLDMAKEPKHFHEEIPEEGLWLVPNEIYLACTNEECGSDLYVTCLEGRSSVGRLGMQVHLTAGFGDLGFKSHWTLEISVIKPVKVYPNVRICQAVFFKPFGVIGDRLYKGKYVSQHGPVPSRMWKDFIKKES